MQSNETLGYRIEVKLPDWNFMFVILFNILIVLFQKFL